MKQLPKKVVRAFWYGYNERKEPMAKYVVRLLCSVDPSDGTSFFTGYDTSDSYLVRGVIDEMKSALQQVLEEKEQYDKTHGR